jgi:hypothetical protein
VTILLHQLGICQVYDQLDRRDTPLTGSARAKSLLTAIGRYREDVAVYLGSDGDSLGGLSALVEGLQTGGYQVSAWRLTA